MHPTTWEYEVCVLGDWLGVTGGLVIHMAGLMLLLKKTIFRCNMMISFGNQAFPLSNGIWVTLQQGITTTN